MKKEDFRMLIGKLCLANLLIEKLEQDLKREECVESEKDEQGISFEDIKSERRGK